MSTLLCSVVLSWLRFFFFVAFFLRYAPDVPRLGTDIPPEEIRFVKRELFSCSAGCLPDQHSPRRNAARATFG